MRLLALGVALLVPGIARTQSVSIESPAEGDTVPGPTVVVRTAVSDFQLGRDGYLRAMVNGRPVATSSTPDVPLELAPGTYEIVVRLVNREGNALPIGTTDDVKVTVAGPQSP